MSGGFSLRALSYEAWTALGACSYDTLAEEMMSRITADDREVALNEAILAYSRDFVGRHRPNRVDRVPLPERLARRTERIGECLVWTGKTDSKGYGVITMATGTGRKKQQLHRVVYEEFVGPIPDLYQIDHICHSSDPEACPGPSNCLHRRCWNPGHLRAVTAAENMRGRKLRGGRKRRQPAA